MASNVVFPHPLGASQGQHLSGTDLESDTVQSRLVSPRVRETDGFKGNGNVGGVGDIRSPSTRRRRLVQNVEDLLSRARPFGTGVELGPEVTERQVGLRRQDQDEQRRLQAEVTGQQAQPDGHGHQCH